MKAPLYIIIINKSRGMVWGGRREEGSGWGTPVADSFQYLAKSIHHCKV